ncbi:MAG: hypothetical protein J6T96_10065 [Bacteroidales bacterium]|nr:hypothetical protein [Bacteroidales bacterium]MBO7462927.1 hypothetical protein [Bacteroidales bacterium]MBO7567233.1 hypothetical protein [Bacteroidales bacterium]
MAKIFFITAFVLLLAGCSEIDFEENVRTANSDTFIDECKFDKADDWHFVYKTIRPSIVFIYSDGVEHCRQQAEVFNNIAALYGNGINFWAMEYDDAQSLLMFFNPTGRLPIYLYINQNCAQMLAPEHTSVSDMKKHIAEAFGIFPQTN